MTVDGRDLLFHLRLPPDPDPHCRIRSVRFKGRDVVWIIPPTCKLIDLRDIGPIRIAHTMGAVRVNDGVIEVTDEGGGS